MGSGIATRMRHETKIYRSVGLFNKECGRWDSNPHALRRHPLKMVRLPVPPLPQWGGESLLV